MENIERELAAIEARANAAARGPWKTLTAQGVFAGAEQNVTSFGGTHILLGAEDGQVGQALEHNADFIAHARTDVPLLLALVREQQAKLDRVEAKLDEWALFQPFPDAEESQRWYSLGKRHAADRIRAALTATEAA